MLWLGGIYGGQHWSSPLFAVISVHFPSYGPLPLMSSLLSHFIPPCPSTPSPLCRAPFVIFPLLCHPHCTHLSFPASPPCPTPPLRRTPVCPSHIKASSKDDHIHITVELPASTKTEEPSSVAKAQCAHSRCKITARELYRTAELKSLHTVSRCYGTESGTQWLGASTQKCGGLGLRTCMEKDGE